MRPTALEVLPVWRESPQGELGAENLIATAGEHGLVNPLSRWLLEQLGGIARTWAEAGLVGTPLVVAIPTELSRAATLVPLVARLLSGSGLPGCSLQLALTEAALVDDSASNRLLERLDELGVGTVIDDYGLGTLPLVNLIRLPIRQLRLRRFWQHCLGAGPRGQRMLRSLAALAHGLELEIVALGVGSDEALDHLRRVGCDMIQGRRLGPALRADGVTALLRNIKATYAA
jgi:EAL domain-containing protein (putative c-di-GMP-specific phosphodiesterase class I)